MKNNHPAGKTAHNKSGYGSTIYLVQGASGVADCMFAEGGYPEQEGPVSNDPSRPAYRRRPSSRSSMHPESAD